jgi:Na+/proline symporter
MMAKMSDHHLLRLMRIVTLSFTVLVTLYAMNSKLSIFKMVENAYQITLVMAFIPLACGVYWKRATNQGALLSIFLGLTTWLAILIAGPEDPFLPAQFAGLIASAVGMVVGSLMPTYFGHEFHVEPHDPLHAHAAHSPRVTHHGHQHEA